MAFAIRCSRTIDAFARSRTIPITEGLYPHSAANLVIGPCSLRSAALMSSLCQPLGLVIRLVLPPTDRRAASIRNTQTHIYSEQMRVVVQGKIKQYRSPARPFAEKAA